MLLHLLLLLLLSLYLCGGALTVPSSSPSLRKKEQNSLFRKHGGVKLTASTAADIFNSDSKLVITHIKEHIVVDEEKIVNEDVKTVSSKYQRYLLDV